MTNMGMASVRKVHPLFWYVRGIISLDDNWAYSSWSTLAQQLLCMRISAVMQAHNSCCATDDTDCLNNIFYLFRQLLLSLPATYPISFDNINYLFQQHQLSLPTTSTILFQQHISIIPTTKEGASLANDTPSSDYSY